MPTAGYDGTAKIWDVATGALLRTLSGHTSEVWDAAFSPDAAYVLTGSRDRTAKLWRTSDGALLRTFVGHGNGVRSVEFRPNSTQVLTMCDGGVTRLWKSGLSPAAAKSWRLY